MLKTREGANGATGGPDSADEDTNVPDAVPSPRPVERSQEMEDTLDKELYNRVKLAIELRAGRGTCYYEVTEEGALSI